MDAGGMMSRVDVRYEDNLGGPGRLETDLRQLFTVYGGLRIRLDDNVSIDNDIIDGRMTIEAKRLQYTGPIHLELGSQPSGILVRSGLLTDLRSILSALRERRIALESQSCERLTKAISPKYGGTLVGRKNLVRKLETEYQSKGARAMLSKNVNILVDQTEAQVIQSILIIARVDDQNKENQHHEKLILHKEGSSWRFAGGIEPY